MILELDRLATRISREAMKRLKAECNRRYATEVSYTPLGKIVTELVIKHLPKVAPAAPEAEPAAELPVPQKRPGRAKGRPKRRALDLAKSA